jgi:hypothetical protein
VFLCNERDKLVSELRHILHAKVFGGNPIFEGKCSFSTELDPPGGQAKKGEKKHEALIRQFPTALQILSRQQASMFKSKDSQLIKPSFGTLLFS